MTTVIFLFLQPSEDTLDVQNNLFKIFIYGIALLRNLNFFLMSKFGNPDLIFGVP